MIKNLQLKFKDILEQIDMKMAVSGKLSKIQHIKKTLGPFEFQNILTFLEQHYFQTGFLRIIRPTLSISRLTLPRSLILKLGIQISETNYIRMCSPNLCFRAMAKKIPSV
jgi:hypothetical protein